MSLGLKTEGWGEGKALGGGGNPSWGGESMFPEAGKGKNEPGNKPQVFVKGLGELTARGLMTRWGGAAGIL